MQRLWIIVCVVGYITYIGNSQCPIKTSWIDVKGDHWTLNSSVPVGMNLTPHPAEKAKRGHVEFSLEKKDSSSIHKSHINKYPSRDLPFRIDEKGVVYTNESIADREGDTIIFYLTVCNVYKSIQSINRNTIIVLICNNTTDSHGVVEIVTKIIRDNPLPLVCGVLLVSSVSICLLVRNICKPRRTSEENDTGKEVSANGTPLEHDVTTQEMVGLQSYFGALDTETAQTESGQCITTGINLDHWEVPRHHLKPLNSLGEGCFGQVWKCGARSIKGRYDAPSIVAVKTLKETAEESEKADIHQELEVMKMLDPHPNVVRLLGCCTDKDPIFIIMEYAPHGELQSYLRQSRQCLYYINMDKHSTTLTSKDLTSFCYQVARGMEFISGKGIIHRDLACRNILLGENQICKVADFGFARAINTSCEYERKTEGRQPIRWMSPESLIDHVFSVKSDVWSYGVLIWEIVTLGSTPYSGMSAIEVIRKVRDGYRLDKPEHCLRELYNIMYACWLNNPAERPTFSDLVTLLEQLLLAEEDYIQLDMFPDHSYYNIVWLSGEKL